MISSNELLCFDISALIVLLNPKKKAPRQQKLTNLFYCCRKLTALFIIANKVTSF
jgi:hypothetical protein